MNVVIEESKQRITAIAEKVRRYQGWVDSYRQNRLFGNNQRQFYRELGQEKKDVMMIGLWLKNRNSFWRNIWSQSADHKKDAMWLQDLQSEVNVKKQRRKILPQEAKNFSSLHKRVRLQLKECLDSGFG